MPPEIWQKQEYTKSCDAYEFGFIVYEIVTNDKPFENKNYFEIALNVANGGRPEFKKKLFQNLIKTLLKVVGHRIRMIDNHLMK